MAVASLALWLPLASAWCCRACGKCMCDSYGVCAPNPPEGRASVHTWSVEEVSTFVESLSFSGENGRDTCPAGCKTPSLFNGSHARFTNGNIDGKALHERLVAQSALESAVRNPNITVSNVTEKRLAFATGLLPDGPDPSRVYLAFWNRLHLSIKSAQVPHHPPPPTPTLPPP